MVAPAVAFSPGGDGSFIDVLVANVTHLSTHWDELRALPWGLLVAQETYAGWRAEVVREARAAGCDVLMSDAPPGGSLRWL